MRDAVEQVGCDKAMTHIVYMINMGSFPYSKAFVYEFESTMRDLPRVFYPNIKIHISGSCGDSL